MLGNQHSAMTDDCGDPGKTTTDHNDYITLDDIFGDTNNDGNDGGFNGPKDVEFIEEMQRHLDGSDNLLYGTPQVAW